MPAIVDSKGVPLINPIVYDSTIADCRLAIDDINKIINNKSIMRATRKVKGKIYLLADSGYDTKEIRKLLKKHNITAIIKPNNRGTKDPKKLRYLNKLENQYYKKRTIVEHFFGFIKRFPKVNCVYERTKKSYQGILSIIFTLKTISMLHKK